MHKHHPLVKPMLITTGDGYIITVLGPYLANGKNNDFGIITHAMKHDTEDMLTWFCENDKLVLDRGFATAIPFLKDLGFQIESPALELPSQSQLSTVNSDKSRLISKLRWPNETANSHLKDYKFLASVFQVYI